ESKQLQHAEYQEDINDAVAELEKLNNEETKPKKRLSTAQQKADEAKTTLRLSGFFGRLGDLEQIDEIHDVAIFTARAQLDNLVCNTSDTPQQYLPHFKKTNAGRAVIFYLDALKTNVIGFLCVIPFPAQSGSADPLTIEDCKYQRRGPTAGKHKDRRRGTLARRQLMVNSLHSGIENVRSMTFDQQLKYCTSKIILCSILSVIKSTNEYLLSQLSGPEMSLVPIDAPPRRNYIHKEVTSARKGTALALLDNAGHENYLKADERLLFITISIDVL
ncbi:hypothetical protein PSTT_01654, partial [Puccinia striiformis]